MSWRSNLRPPDQALQPTCVRHHEHPISCSQLCPFGSARDRFETDSGSRGQEMRARDLFRGRRASAKSWAAINRKHTGAMKPSCAPQRNRTLPPIAELIRRPAPPVWLGRARQGQDPTLHSLFVLENGSDICTVQEWLGHRDVTTMMIYAHVLHRGPAGVRIPLDGM